jgi:ABC-type dipeptide/oligopeptide/nickel transport system permease component
MLGLYVIVAIVLGLFCAYRIGQVDDYTRREIGPLFLIIVPCWPAVLVLAIVAGPFVGVYYLGHRKREAAREAAKDKRP